MFAWSALVLVLVIAVALIAYGAARSARLTREHEALLARERAKVRSADAELGRLEAEVARLRAGGGPGAMATPATSVREEALAAREAQLAAKDAQLAARAMELTAREETLNARVAEVERRERAQVERAEPHPVLVVHTPQDAESELARTQMLDRTAMIEPAPE